MKWLKGLLTGMQAAVIVLWMSFKGCDFSEINAVLREIFEDKDSE